MSYDVNNGIFCSIPNCFQIILRFALFLFLILPAEIFALSINFDKPPKRIRQSGPISRPDAATQKKIVEDYENIPLGFVKNEGQIDSQVRYLARGKGYSLFLTPAEAVLCLHPQTVDKYSDPSLKTSSFDVVRMRLQGGNRLCKMKGQKEQAGKTNYFMEGNPNKWKTGVKQYGQVRMEEVYPGVDMVYYGNKGKLEYDFLVKSGASPNLIRLKFQGTEAIGTDVKGNLVLKMNGRDILFKAPVMYQMKNGERKTVEGQYVILEEKQVGFEVSGYDPSKDLVIDPVLDYSTYLGCCNDMDGQYGIAVDSSGNAYVTGDTFSPIFPTTAGAYQPIFAGVDDVFITKLNPTGTSLMYSTYLGGNGYDEGICIAVDSNGNAYVAGWTTSANFPTTAGAYQTVFGGNGSTGDAFVTELNSTGSALVYSTYLGGSGYEECNGIELDSIGNTYVTGYTNSNDFPTTAGAYQMVYSGGLDHAFVTKLNATGGGVYSTYLEGSFEEQGNGISVDSTGHSYVTGYTYSTDFPTTAGAYQTSIMGTGNAFVTKLNLMGTGLVYSTYLGGTSYDSGYGIAVDSSGNAFVTGNTTSTNFPTTSGAYQTTSGGGGLYDAFVTKLNATGTGLVYSTYLGGSGNDQGYGIALDSNGYAYVTGSTQSTDFPVSAGAYQMIFGGSGSLGGDAFVTALNPTGTGLLYSTYLGGSTDDDGWGIAVDSGGNVYVTGETHSTNFPTTTGAFQATYISGGGFDAFVTKFSVVVFSTPTPTPTATPTAVFSPTPACQTHVWPDPFNPNYAVGGTLKVSCLPVGATVSFYTVSGELMNQVDAAGGMAQWNGTNRQGAPVSSGIYFYVIQSGSNVLEKGKFLINH